MSNMKSIESNDMTKKRHTGKILWVLVIAALLALAYIVGRMTAGGRDGDGASDAVAQNGDREILYWQAPMNPTEIYDKPGKSAMGMDLVPVYADEVDSDSAKNGETADREILYWQAPMNPTEIYDKPGKSAMGMDLIPVYADEAGAGSGGLVSIDPAVVQNMGVRTAPVQQMDFTREIRTVGKVEYNEESLHTVTTKISGWIEDLHVAFTGESVKKGDPLLDIYSPELVATQQEYLLALRNRDRALNSTSEAAIRDAEKLLNSTRERLEYWDIPKSEIDRLERTGEVKKTVLLDSPASGIVVKKTAVEGAFVKSGMDLYEIGDLSTVWVHASVYDNEVPWITNGQKAEMEMSYQPGRTYHGRVSYIYPYLREKARDVHVRLIFSNPDLALKPGMYVNVTLQGKVIPNTLAIPSEAVIRSGERSLVFVVRGPGKFEPREIQIGEEGGPGNNYVRVISGLLGNEEVVTSAQFMLDSESRLQEAIQKMLDERKRGSTPGVDSAGGMKMDPGDAGMKGEDAGMKGMDMDHDGGETQMKPGGAEMDHDGGMPGVKTGPDTGGMKMDHGKSTDHDAGSNEMRMDHDGGGIKATSGD